MSFAPASAFRRILAHLTLTALVGTVACSGGADGSGGTGPSTPVPASIALPAPTLALNAVGATSTVAATVRDAQGATLAGATVTWSSDAPAVATVSGSGTSATITAQGRGTAVITARAGSVSSSVTVTVRAAFAVGLAPNVATVRVGNTTPLQATVSADPGASQSVTWSTDAPTIASVSPQGVVTGITPGSAVITARSVSAPAVSASATIMVAPQRSVVVSPSDMSLGRAESRTISAQVFVDGGASTALMWRTNRPLIATVNQQGVVTGISDGEATITAISVADTTLRAAALVRVVPIVRSIVVSPMSAQLNIGQTRAFSATTVVDQGANGAIAWSSSNPAVASVNAFGVATAVGTGTALIRARSVADTTREVAATLFVEARPVSLSLGTSTLGLVIGRSATIAANVSADPGITTAVEWTSRNPAVASVSPQGLVTALGSGTTRLVAQAVADPDKRDSVTVTVVPQLAAAWSSERLGGPLIEDIVSLWARTASLAYAVNSLGDVYRWDGETWTIAVRGAQFNTSFTAVHGVSATAVTAVGTRGVIARFDGNTWSTMASGTTANLDAVWMHAADTAWAVGAGGVALRRTGGAWTLGESGTTARLRGVSGNGIDAFAVGDGGVIRRWSDGQWRAVASGTSEVLHDVWAGIGAGGPVYVAGDFGTLLRWNGAGFDAEPSGTTASLLAVSATLSGSVLASGDGVALTRTNDGWREQSVPYLTRFSSAAIDGSGALWIGGQRGLVMRGATTGAWATLSLTPDLLDVWSSSATHALAVGELGFIFRYDGATWTRQAAPTLERLNTVWAASSSVAFAGGDNGVLLRWNGSSWSEQTSPTGEHVYAMWGADADDVWAVTEGGEVLHWTGSAWRIAHDQSAPLYGIHGTSRSDVHVVGLNGTVLHWDGRAWETRNTGTSHVLVGLWAAESRQAVTVGARDFTSGVALRYDGTWSEVPAGTTQILSAVWGAVGSDLYAVGDAGTVVRYNGSGWQAMSSGASDFLWAVSGAPDASGAGFAVGLNGTVLRASAPGQAAGMRVGTTTRTPANLEPRRGARAAESDVLRRGTARKRR